MLKVREIDVMYGRLHALRDVSFRIEEGEIVSLVGGNAAGKSTVLNTISGLLRPVSGTVEFLGERIDGFPPHRIVESGISHVPEGGKLFSDMTVLENLDLGSYVRRARNESGEMLEQAFHLFPVLKRRLRQLARTLSGGEKQMVAIARGLMSKPRLLMLDEPSHGLAPIVLGEIFQIVQRLSDSGSTVLLVEQNVQRSLEISSRGYVLENSRIVLKGAGSELLKNEKVKEAYLGL